MENEYDILKLKNQLCFPIYLCSKEIIRKYTPILNELDLTYTQYIVMMYFWEVGSSNVKDLGRVLLLDSSTLTPLLKKLESKGYIKRERLKSDERNLVVSITELGLSLRDKALAVPDKMAKCLDLNKEDTENLYKLAYKVLSNIRKDDEL